MSKPRHSGPPSSSGKPGSVSPGKTTTKDSKSSRHHNNKNWTRRTKSDRDGPYGDASIANTKPEWQGTGGKPDSHVPKSAPPPISMLPKIPPLMGKQPMGVPGTPIIPYFPMFNPMMNQNFIMPPKNDENTEGKNDPNVAKNPKMKFPMVNPMPMQGVPPPGMLVNPFLSMPMMHPKVGPFVGNRDFVPKQPNMFLVKEAPPAVPGNDTSGGKFEDGARKDSTDPKVFDPRMQMDPRFFSNPKIPMDPGRFPMDPRFFSNPKIPMDPGRFPMDPRFFVNPKMPMDPRMYMDPRFFMNPKMPMDPKVIPKAPMMPMHNTNVLNLSQVNLQSRDGTEKKNLETMSVISDDCTDEPHSKPQDVKIGYSDHVSAEQDRLDHYKYPGGSMYKDRGRDFDPSNVIDIKYMTSFMPKPPERYMQNHSLHGIKMFLPLGLKAYARSMGINPEMLSGFDNGPVRNGKLVLLLDLDNTLLHTASQSRLDMLDIDISHFVDELGDPELYKFSLPNFPNITYYMKLRPCIREFLQVLSLYYEMSIYTNATKEYADVVISILDPDRTLFMDRIVARNSVDEKDLLKSAARLYPDLNRRFVLAFDDRKDVWADIPHRQVVRAEHYDFFESYSMELANNYGFVAQDAFSPDVPGPQMENTSKSSNNLYISQNFDGNAENTEGITDDKDVVRDYDRHLRHMITLFLEIHKRFFNDPFNANVGTILENLQSETLKDTRVLLTGYRKNAKGISNVLHSDCEQRQREVVSELGSIVLNKITDPGLTHIVAGKNCTDNIAKSRNSTYSHIHKVHTLWLYACKATFSRVDEKVFDMDKICNLYNNEPPSTPSKDHWRLLYLSKNAEKDGTDTGYKSGYTHSASGNSEPPLRIFMGTGAYSHGTEVLSPNEKIIIRWDPSKTKLLQNTLQEPITGSKVISDVIIENAPYTNSLNPNKYTY
ncbi:conserved hypothetical protein [Theileria equi strain WA]|uniref:protein-serine/threonine phosphatase n=1 Tax=Theileria equi strain WA TaxID=1537102 RepID=L1LCB3_THEEQ|nr:conserved hypothetical protein [Theileria equi strain WA]EKX73087.1 conserved hypothetical protein [Theileria equi strain WA]|eukprot:XP_004832539.1 conserved hypothetical protein [Theileria equi strain WA]